MVGLEGGFVWIGRVDGSDVGSLDLFELLSVCLMGC